MAHIAFPFWTLRAKNALVHQSDEAVAFSSVETAMAYLNSQLNGSGELKLVSRQSMGRLLTEIRQQNLTAIRLDPAADGSGGRQSLVSELATEFC